MSARVRYPEVVRVNSGYFARIRGANSRKVWQSEVYTRPEAALNALRVLGDLFGVGKARVDREWLHVPTADDGDVSAWLAIPIRHVDERTAVTP